MWYNDDVTPNIGGRVKTQSNRSSEDANLNAKSILKCDLFDGIPQFSDVVRYHSLSVQFPPLNQLLVRIKENEGLLIQTKLSILG